MSSVFRNILGLDKVKGDVGIEVEVEFPNNTNMELTTDIRNQWQLVNDGSLRNLGLEFVSLPLPIEEVPKNLDILMSFINKHKPIETSRSSVHVHVNCLELTPLQIMTGLTFAWCIEEGLLNECAKHRRGNRFCLSIRDSIWLVKKISSLAETNHYMFNVSSREFKYANIAFHNLRGKGTIEFRGMDGRYDAEHLTRWVNICYNTIHNSIKHFSNPFEVIEGVLNNPEIITKILDGVELNLNRQDIEDNCMLLYSLTTIDWNRFEEAYINKKKSSRIYNNNNIEVGPPDDDFPVIDDFGLRLGARANGN